MGKMAEKAAHKNQLKQMQKKLKNLTQAEVDYIVSLHIENVMKMPVHKRFWYSFRLFFKF